MNLWCQICQFQITSNWRSCCHRWTCNISCQLSLRMNSLHMQQEETSSANYKASKKDHKPHHKASKLLKTPPLLLPQTENVFNPVCPSPVPKWSFSEPLTLKKAQNSPKPKLHAPQFYQRSLTRDSSVLLSHNTSSNLVTAAVTRTWNNKSCIENYSLISSLSKKRKSLRKVLGTTWTRSHMMIGNS